MGNTDKFEQRAKVIAFIYKHINIYRQSENFDEFSDTTTCWVKVGNFLANSAFI